MASILFYCEPEELHLHGSPTGFLDECSKCRKPLDRNDDVFMYQGITAFCSEECRQCQIEMDNPPRRRTSYKLPARRYWMPSFGTTAPATGARPAPSTRVATTA